MVQRRAFEWSSRSERGGAECELLGQCGRWVLLGRGSGVARVAYLVAELVNPLFR